MAVNLRDYSRTAAQRGWGAGWPSCGGAKTAGTAVVTADRSGVRMSVHKRVARLIDLLVNETERRGYLMKNGQVGGYNCRPIGNTSSPSNHSWGLAVDINWQDNPYTTNLARRTIPDWAVTLWNRYGFAWGGHYRGARKDFMHMEFMGTPGDADEMTALAIRELTPAPAPPPISAPVPAAPPLRSDGDDVMYIKCQPDPKQPAWVAVLSGPMFVGLSTPGEIASAEGEIKRGAACQWVEAHTWMDLDRRSHALCDNPRPVVVTASAAAARFA